MSSDPGQTFVEHDTLGPQMTMLVSTPQGTLIRERTDRSEPFEISGYKRWGREKVSEGMNPGSKNVKKKVRQTKALNSDTGPWQSELGRSF